MKGEVSNVLATLAPWTGRKEEQVFSGAPLGQELIELMVNKRVTINDPVKYMIF